MIFNTSAQWRIIQAYGSTLAEGLCTARSQAALTESRHGRKKGVRFIFLVGQKHIRIIVCGGVRTKELTEEESLDGGAGWLLFCLTR